MKNKTECILCGTPTKPWFETCFNCHQLKKQEAQGAVFPDEIKAADFMKQMGICHW